MPPRQHAKKQSLQFQADLFGVQIESEGTSPNAFAKRC